MSDSNTRIAVVGDYEGVQAGSAHVARLRERPGVGAVEVFGDPIPPGDIATTLADYQIVIAIRERTPFPEHVLAELPDLELISQSGTHAAHVDLDAATRAGVLVACGPGDPGGGKRPSLMSELVLGMLFSLTRELPSLQREMAVGNWPSSVGRSVREQTLGILGLGRHGLALSRVAATLGMRVVAWGPTLTDERAADAGVKRYEELDDLLGEADVVSIHLKLSDLSRGLIDERRLGLMRSHAILINTARGAIVDEVAMAEALAQGGLGGAGLDVFVEEPLPADSPLRTLPNVVLTPHVGWTVDRNLEEFAEDTVHHVDAYLDGSLRLDALLDPGAAHMERRRTGGVAG